jgi:hypothetical protein
VIMKMEGTLYPDWTELNDYNSRIQRERIQVTPELQKLSDDITREEKDADGKIADLYHWVQQNIKYNSIKSSRSSGWAGHPAAETFEKKIGDCTDVSILFCTLLKAIGFEAYPIIIRTNDAGEAMVDIPTPDGNHCITKVIKPDGKQMYLDCTAESYRYPYFRMDDVGAWAVNFIKGDRERIPVPPPEDNMQTCEMMFKLDAKANAAVLEVNDFTGTLEAGMRGYLQSIPPDQRLEVMQRYMARRSPGATLMKFETTELRDLKKPLETHQEYSVPSVGTRAGDLLIVKIERLEWNFAGDTALETRKYPIENNSSIGWKRRWIYELPGGYTVKFLPDPINIDTKHVTYKASMAVEDNASDKTQRVIVSDLLTFNTRQVPTEDYKEYREALKKVSQWSKNYIFLQVAH